VVTQGSFFKTLDLKPVIPEVVEFIVQGLKEQHIVEFDVFRIVEIQRKKFSALEHHGLMFGKGRRH